VYGTESKDAIDGSYIVLLKDGADAKGGKEGVAAKSVSAQGGDLAQRYGGKLGRTYDSAVHGFSASGLDKTEAKRLAA
ncbi:protease inhibitor I9 family protein, partial [Brevibacillus formosus]|uniref:protease inhibitor I9 family protein n=2 Tax=Bacillati TaxID=1783272 RepID=UPI003F198A23